MDGDTSGCAAASLANDRRAVELNSLAADVEAVAARAAGKAVDLYSCVAGLAARKSDGAMVASGPPSLSS